MQKKSEPSKNPVITAGDFNVCPRPVLDEWDPEQEYTNFDWKLKKTLTEQFPLPETHVSPEMRRAIKKLDDLGMKDVFCERFPKEKADTYWDYFKNAFSDKRGLRIDLVLASGVLAKSLESIEVDTLERTPEKILKKENKDLIEKYKDAIFIFFLWDGGPRQPTLFPIYPPAPHNCWENDQNDAGITNPAIVS